MNTKQEVRRIRVSEPRASWEDQGSSEVAAGKLEVMEKFFTPLPQSSGHRGAKGQRKKDTSWEGIRDQYYKECMSTSSPSSSSSPWSSESNFGVRGRFSGYQPLAPQSRSCNDLSVARARENEEKRDGIVKKKEDAHARKSARDGAERSSPRIFKSEPTQKSNSGHTKNAAPNSKSQPDDKRMLKNGGRRAKSMEALTAKETRKGQGSDRKRGNEEKQRFSRFLDEITIQVLSPSNLNSLGVKERHRSHSNREQWKNSSTDSSGSRGKRTQHSAVVEQQEGRRKGKGKAASSTKTKMATEPSVPCRSREMSTSPDSVSSSTWRRGEREEANLGASPASHQPKRSSGRVSQEKGTKSANITELPKEKKEAMMSGGGVLKGKVQYSDKAQNSECTTDLAAKNPNRTQSSWWGGPGGPVLSPHSEKHLENFTGTSGRKNEKFSGTHSSVQIQDTDHQSSTQTENLEQDKDSLNQKITELLDHLVRAQGTICALEKLNVSSLLRHLPADMLESMKNSHQGPGIQTDGLPDCKSSCSISLQTSSADICSGDVKSNREDGKEEGGTPAPRLTAFTPWSPRRQRSFLALHTLYNSTESECSLEDMLPPCKLLSPRFPNLGESFSDDRKDDGNSDDCDAKTDQKLPGALKPSPSLPSLLPTHRIPQQNHHVSSSESSGEDTLINWVDMRSPDPALDYMSAQKILDTLLGLTTPSDRFAIPKPQNLIDFSSKIEGHIMRREIQLSNNPKGNTPTNDFKNISYAASNQNDPHNYTERCSKLDNFVYSHYNPSYSPNDDLTRKLQSTEYITPPLLAKRSSLSGNFADTRPLLNPVAEVGFRPLGKTEDTAHHKSIPPSSLSIHDRPGDPPAAQCIPFVLRSPSGSESIVGTWEGQRHSQEGGREKKTKKERTVTFDTKFMPNRFEDHGQGDSALDSTLL